MNTDERAKVRALNRHVRIPDFGFGAKVIKNLTWRLEHNPTAVLAPRERHLLDLCCWHYRNKLGGLVEFELPSAEPMLADYVPRPASLPQESLL